MKAQLLPGGQSWGIFAKADESFSPSTFTITGSAQATIVVPTGFQIDSIISVSGLWTNNATVVNPVENPGKTYISFGLVMDNPPILYNNGERLLFKFYSHSACPDSMHLIQNGVDPFDQLPNSMNTNPGNEITVIDFGAGAAIYNYGGIYAPSAWNCHDCDGDGILNAFEDTNGDGEWTPGVDASPLCGEGGGGGGCTDPEFSSQPNNAKSCSGESLTLSAAVGNVSDPTFQWQMSSDGGLTWTNVIDNSNFEGAQTGSLFIENVAGMHSFRFRLKAADDTCETISNAATLTIEGPITISGQMQEQEVCSGEPTSFTIQASAGMAGTLAYQWQTTQNGGLSWTNIISSTDNGIYTNFTSKTLNISDVSGLHGRCYRVKLTTGECDAFYSQNTCLTVLGPVAITSQPQDAIACDGSEATFSVEAENQSPNPLGPLFYQWQTSTDGGATWTDLNDNAETSGAQSGSLSLSNVSGKNKHRFRVLVSTNDCNASTSAAAVLSVVGPFSVTAQPAGFTGCDGSAAVFEASISNATGEGTLKFRWELSCNGGLDWVNFMPGGQNDATGFTTEKLEIADVSGLGGCQVRLRYWTDECSYGWTEPATINVEGPVKFTEQPQPATTCTGNPICFETAVENEGAGTLNFQWQYSKDGNNWLTVSDDNIFSGSTTTQLCLSDVSGQNGSCFRLLAQTQTCTSVASEVACLEVVKPVEIAVQPQDLTECETGTAAFSVSVTNTSADDVTYQWQVSTDQINFTNIEEGGPEGYSGVNSTAFQIANLAGLHGTDYRLQVITPGCSAFFSETAHLTVEGSLAYDQQPEAVTTCAGSAAEFAVATTNATGMGSMVYQWEISGDGQTWEDVSANSNFSGTNSNTLKINDVSGFDQHQFRSKVRTGACGWLISTPAMLSVEGPLSVTLQPQDATVCPDSAQVFEAAVTNAGAGNMNLQWQMSTDAGNTWSNISPNQSTGFGGNYTGVNTKKLKISRTEGLGDNRYRLTASTAQCTAHSAGAVLFESEDTCPDPIAYECLGMKLKWLPEQQRWAVFIKPEGFTPPVYNNATSGRVTVVAPVGFTYTGLSSKAGGTWKPGIVTFNPPGAPGMQFMMFNLTPNNNQLLLAEGEEIMLFSFAKVGDCPANIYLMDEYVPQSFQPNELTGIGLGLGFGPDMYFKLCSIYDREAAKCNPGHAMGAIQGPIGGNAAPAEAVDWFRMSPNPARDWLDVSFKNDWTNARATLRVLNLKGQVVHTEPNVTGGYLKLNLRHLIPGQYFVVLESEGKVLQQEKLMKH